ncbi:hypothetical protein L2E82_45401 [Cichorium intybus]|uniref:Uncharacterized protein n=1 Tax=Cichorium intybus TaxID=13427 RepID=A0ACB8ZT79_CICIN|nr:hypothetical protein L2E82_45401 [Cichorium intybus]
METLHHSPAPHIYIAPLTSTPHILPRVTVIAATSVPHHIVARFGHQAPHMSSPPSTSTTPLLLLFHFVELPSSLLLNTTAFIALELASSKPIDTLLCTSAEKEGDRQGSSQSTLNRERQRWRKGVTRENDFQIYNSMTKQKENFNPITPGKVAMYVCAVISYDFSHIGHARAYVAFDFLFRYLKYLGYEVKYVRNFTDVDDKGQMRLFIQLEMRVQRLSNPSYTLSLWVNNTSDGGLALSQNVCFMQQNQELSIQNEYSPALPGYKGTSDQKGSS